MDISQQNVFFFVLPTIFENEKRLTFLKILIKLNYKVNNTIIKARNFLCFLYVLNNSDLMFYIAFIRILLRLLYVLLRSEIRNNNT